MPTPTVVLALLAGTSSFLSPCMIPVLPAFVATVGGAAADEARPARRHLAANALLFVLGFSLVFATMGVALESLLAGAAASAQTWLARVAGAVIVGFGLHTMGLVEVRALERGRALPGERFSGGGLASLALGGAFAVTWTPCVGPILGSSFALAASQPADAFAIMSAYSIGLGLPFLGVALAPRPVLDRLAGRGRLAARLQVAFGVVLLALGVLVFTERLSLLGSLLFTLEVSP